MGLVHGFDANETLVPLLLAADGSIIAAAKLYNAAGVAIQTDAAGDLIVAGKDGAGTARILRTDANGQLMISALDTGGSVRQVRCTTSGDLTVGGRDAAANGYPLRTDNTGELSILGHLLNRLFAFGDTVFQNVQNTSLAAGTNNLDANAVPANKVNVYTNLGISYTGTTTNVILAVYVWDGANLALLFAIKAPTSQIEYDRQGWWPVKAGSKIRATVYGATLNDDAYLDVFGFQMDA
jgi:hypothetical protein